MADDRGGSSEGGGFGIDLKALSDAIATVQRERDGIAETLDKIEYRAFQVAYYWQGPANETFDPVVSWYKKAAWDLLAILDEIILRLKKSYDNYRNAESQNAANMTPV